MNCTNLSEPCFNVAEEIEIVERIEDNKKIFIIKNSSNNKFFKFGETEYKLMMAFNGERNTYEVVDYLKNVGINISFEKVEKFKQNLLKLQFIKSNNEISVIEKKEADTRRDKTFFEKILFIKISLVNPNSFIEKLVNKFSFLFSPVFIFFMTIYIALGIFVYIHEFSPWTTNLITNSTTKNITIVVMLYLITMVASIFHEMAHAVTCKKFGGKVHEVGILFLYFRPGLFCNISDSYLFKDRKHRIYVSIAGIFLDFVVWSTILIIGFFLNLNGIDVYFIPSFGLYGLITILLEFNPLIKLDGYYTLTEVVNIYNLRENSFRYLKNNILKRKSKIDVKKRDRNIYVIYSVFSSVYCVWLIINTIYIVTEYLISKLSDLGVAIAVVIIILLFHDIIAKSLSFILGKFINKSKNRRLANGK